MNLIDSLVFGFIPFLISVIIIYNLLNKTKIFGTGKSAMRTNAIIAITISSYVFLGFVSSAELIIKTFLLIPLLVLLMFFGVVGYKTVLEMKISNPKETKEKILTFLVVLFLIILIALYIFIKL